jgi:hypothetical protein
MGVRTGKIHFNGVNSSGLPAIVDLDVTGGLLGGPITYQVVDCANDSTVVLNAPGYVYGIAITTTLNANAVLVKDNTATILTIAASTTAGTRFDLYGVYCATNITISPNVSSTGTFTIFYRAA